jgi:hypothetical protein
MFGFIGLQSQKVYSVLDYRMRKYVLYWVTESENIFCNVLQRQQLYFVSCYSFRKIYSVLGNNTKKKYILYWDTKSESTF